MSSHVFTLSLDPKDSPAFEALVTEIVVATQKETSTQIYEYSINSDRTVVRWVKIHAVPTE